MTIMRVRMDKLIDVRGTDNPELAADAVFSWLHDQSPDNIYDCDEADVFGLSYPLEREDDTIDVTLYPADEPVPDREPSPITQRGLVEWATWYRPEIVALP